MQIPNIASLDLEITTLCDNACEYCYIGMVKLKKMEGCIGEMSEETINDVFELIKNFGYPKLTQTILPDGQKTLSQPTHIDFYGGEPLMSFGKVKYFIEESKKRGMKLSFTLLSNGNWGDKEQFDYLKANHCWIQRSIDGHPGVQEKYRPNSVGKYLEVRKVIRDFKDPRRMTVQPEFAKEILNSMYWFEEQGYTKGVSPQPNFYADWSDEQIEDFKKSLWDLAKYYVERWKNNDPFYVFYFSEEINGRFMGRRKFGCGGARGLHCVSWDGWLYTCHRFSKEPHDSQFCFGTVKETLAGTAKGYGEELVARVEAHKKNCESDWNEECRYCIAYKTCEKGCMHTNVKCTGRLNQPPKLYCRLRQEAVKIVDWLDDELRRLDPFWWTRGNTAKGGQNFMNQKRQRQKRQPNQGEVQGQGNSLWCQEISGNQQYFRK